MAQQPDENPPRSWWEDISAIKTAQAAFESDTKAQLGFLRTWKQDQNGDIKEIRTTFSEFRDTFNEFRESSGKWLLGLLTAIIMMLLAVGVNIFVSRSHSVHSTDNTEVLLTIEHAITTRFEALMREYEVKPVSSDKSSD